MSTVKNFDYLLFLWKIVLAICIWLDSLVEEFVKNFYNIDESYQD